MKQSVICIFTLIVLTSCVKNVPKVWEPKIFKAFKKNKQIAILPDYSYAGYMYNEQEIPEVNAKQFNVEDFGAIANDSIDDTKAINATIEAAGRYGGGVVFFTPGTFRVNMDTTKTDIVKINYSNIVMRGSGSGTGGTVIFSGTSTHQATGNSPWLSPFVFHSGLNLQGTDAFFKSEDLDVFSIITKDLEKGVKTIEVAQTKGLKTGDIILIAMRNTTDEGDLMYDLMKPLEFEPFQENYIQAGKRRAESFQYTAEVERVIDANHLELKQPLRRAISLKFEPTIRIMPILKHVGIEHFKFESAWDGNYVHHGNQEMTYGWGAINLHRVSQGWIRDIHIDNYTQTVHLINSRNVTVEDVKITGKAGHYSPKMYHASDNLVQNIDIESKVTHGPGLEGCSFGNVYRKLNYTYPSTIDFHGMSGPDFCPPMYNLFENITSISSVQGGGAPFNIPHSGVYNTLWNIEMTGWTDNTFQEIFFSWIWRNPDMFKNKMHIDSHKQYLRTIMVGVRSSQPNKKLSVEHSTEDRSDQWIYIEGLNTSEKMESLFEAQLKLRLGKLPSWMEQGK